MEVVEGTVVEDMMVEMQLVIAEEKMEEEEEMEGQVHF